MSIFSLNIQFILGTKKYFLFYNHLRLKEEENKNGEEAEDLESEEEESKDEGNYIIYKSYTH